MELDIQGCCLGKLNMYKKNKVGIKTLNQIMVLTGYTYLQL